MRHRHHGSLTPRVSRERRLRLLYLVTRSSSQTSCFVLLRAAKLLCTRWREGLVTETRRQIPLQDLLVHEVLSSSSSSSFSSSSLRAKDTRFPVPSDPYKSPGISREEWSFFGYKENTPSELFIVALRIDKFLRQCQLFFMHR